MFAKVGQHPSRYALKILAVLAALLGSPAAASEAVEEPAVAAVSLPEASQMQRRQWRAEPAALSDSFSISDRSLKRTRRYQLTTTSGLGMIGVGAAFTITGALLEIYNYNGPWEQQWVYNERFETRLAIAGVMLPIGVTTLAVGGVVSAVGILGQGLVLARRTGKSRVVAYTAIGMLTGALVTLPIGFATFSGVITVTSISLGAVSLGLIIAQSVMNHNTIRRLPDEERSYIRKGKRKAQVAFAPTFDRSGGGAMVFGRF